jgi:hypothetical protein
MVPQGAKDMVGGLESGAGNVYNHIAEILGKVQSGIPSFSGKPNLNISEAMTPDQAAQMKAWLSDLPMPRALG